MRNLPGGKIVAIAVAMMLPFAAFAQTKKSGNYHFLDFQDKPYYFGLTLGYNSSNFVVLNSEQFIRNDSFLVAEGRPGPGFNVSIVTNIKIGDYFDFRFLPGFSFVERSIDFREASNGQQLTTRTIESVIVQAPFHVRYKSAPFKDKRAFVVAGIKYSYDVASNARVRKEQSESLIQISPHDFALEVGAGIQFFFPFFIFSPEIKFSQGLGNILLYNDALEQSRVLEKVLSRTFTVSLHFEG